jgi:hypothetical protein
MLFLQKKLMWQRLKTKGLIYVLRLKTKKGLGNAAKYAKAVHRNY